MGRANRHCIYMVVVTNAGEQGFAIEISNSPQAYPEISSNLARCPDTGRKSTNNYLVSLYKIHSISLARLSKQNHPPHFPMTIQPIHSLTHSQYSSMRDARRVQRGTGTA